MLFCNSKIRVTSEKIYCRNTSTPPDSSFSDCPIGRRKNIISQHSEYIEDLFVVLKLVSKLSKEINTKFCKELAKGLKEQTHENCLAINGCFLDHYKDVRKSFYILKRLC